MNWATFLQGLLFFTVSAFGQQFTISTFAGGIPPQGIPAATASIGDPPRVAVDSAGNFYFASLHSLFKVDSSGTLALLAGDGKSGSATGLPAEFVFPYGIAVDHTGVLYIADRDANVIRIICQPGSQCPVNLVYSFVAPFAGTGVAGYSGDHGPASAAQLNGPTGLALDAAGNLYVADTGNSVIRKITPDGTITTVAGNNNQGYGGDGGPATSAMLSGPEGVAVDSAGNLYIADTFNHRIREVSAGGTITTFAATGFPGFSGDNGPAAQANLFLPTDVAVDAQGNVYIADLGNSRIREVSQGIIRTVAGSSNGVQPMNNILAVSARFNGPTGVAVDSTGAIYLAEGSVGSGSGLDIGDYRIWKVTPDDVLTTAAGTGARSYSGDGAAATKAQFDTPGGMAFDLAGNLYIADSLNSRVRMVTPAGIITTVAGNGTPGFSGDGGAAVNAQLNHPAGVTVDPGGVIFIADSGNNRIRRVTRDGLIATIAGNGNAAFFGDGARAEVAALHNPQGVAVDASDNIYIADTGSQRVRKIGTDDIINTITAAGTLNVPAAVALDSAGNIYIADQGTGNVLKVPAGGSVTNIAGGLSGPMGLAVDAGGNVYVSDTGHNQVLAIAPGHAAVTLAGTGACCYSGDGGPSTAAQLNQPWGVVADQIGNIYIADSGNNAVRVLSTGSASGSFIYTVANAASNLPGAIAPGEIVGIFGAGFGSNPQVFIGGMAAQVLFASARQVNAIVPPGLPPSPAQIMIQSQGATTNVFTAPWAAAAPGIFTLDSSGSGPAVVFPPTPATAGSQLTLYFTGYGEVTLPISVTIGGRPAVLVSSGEVSPGLLQVTVQVPAGLPPGPVPVILMLGGFPSQSGVTITAAGN